MRHVKPIKPQAWPRWMPTVNLFAWSHEGRLASGDDDHLLIIIIIIIIMDIMIRRKKEIKNHYTFYIIINLLLELLLLFVFLLLCCLPWWWIESQRVSIGFGIWSDWKNFYNSKKKFYLLLSYLLSLWLGFLVVAEAIVCAL